MGGDGGFGKGGFGDKGPVKDKEGKGKVGICDMGTGKDKDGKRQAGICDKGKCEGKEKDDVYEDADDLTYIDHRVCRRAEVCEHFAA